MKVFVVQEILRAAGSGRYTENGDGANLRRFSKAEA